MDTFLTAVARNEVWWDFFYTELITSLRRSEIRGLMWQDFDEKAGTLKILRSVNISKAGELEIGETKSSEGRRTIRLPPSTVRRLKERKKHAVSQWTFPEPLASEKPVRPSAAYYWMNNRLQAISGLIITSINFSRGKLVDVIQKIFYFLYRPAVSTLIGRDVERVQRQFISSFEFNTVHSYLPYIFNSTLYPYSDRIYYGFICSVTIAVFKKLLTGKL